MTAKPRRILLTIVAFLLAMGSAHAEKITIAAAADLKFAMDDIVKAFKTTISAARPDGSSVEIGVNATLAAEGDQAPILGLIELEGPRAAPPGGP